MTSSEKLSAQIDDLWQKHLPLMRSRIETIQSALDALRKNRLGEDLRDKAKESAHKLAGSLGTFGLRHASDDASEIERLLTHPVPTNDNAIRVLDRHVTRLNDAIDSRRP
jgi:HPt (histidine-containing phosphotransfer) domain-containing protein